MTRRKGIILAGGTGSRLFPLTHAVSKQLLPVFDKPMIYYPLAVMIDSGIKEIAIILAPGQRDAFAACLGDGRKFGVRIEYIVQPSPDGLAQAYVLAERFLDGSPSMMVLGDNLFLGAEMNAQIRANAARPSRATAFGYTVEDPENYGVVRFDRFEHPISIEEKPEVPPSNCAVTGLYLLDGDAPRRARAVRPSQRGELEITDLLQSYLEDSLLDIVRLGAGRWFDAGSPENLHEASSFVKNQAELHGRIFGSPELAALQQGWISPSTLTRTAGPMRRTSYGKTLRTIASSALIAEQTATAAIA